MRRIKDDPCEKVCTACEIDTLQNGLHIYFQLSMFITWLGCFIVGAFLVLSVSAYYLLCKKT